MRTEKKLAEIKWQGKYSFQWSSLRRNIKENEEVFLNNIDNLRLAIFKFLVNQIGFPSTKGA